MDDLGERRAVVVGINQYEDPAVRPHLKGAENDAREVFLRLKKFGGFKVDQEKHLLLGKEATSEKIRRAISDLFWKKDPWDIVVFYFSGHGFLDDYGNGFLAPWDHEYKDPLVHGIRMQELRQYFLCNSNKAQALLILDCCHSGVTAELAKGATGDLAGRFYDSLSNQQPANIGNGKFILASSGADEKSREMNAAHAIRILDKKEDKLDCDDLDNHDHGVMTYHLLEGMNGGAAEGDRVTIGKLYNYVREKVNAHRDEEGNDFRVYDCVCSTYEEGPASQTMLVSASSKSKIEQTLNKTETAIVDDDQWPVPDQELALAEGFPLKVVHPDTLLKAVRAIDDALKISPGSVAARSLVTVVDAKLVEYEGYVNAWLLNQNVYWTPQFRDEFGLLQIVVSELCFASLRKLDSAQSLLVMLFLCVTMGDRNRKLFENCLKRGPFTRAQNRGGGLNNAPASGGTIQ